MGQIPSTCTRSEVCPQGVRVVQMNSVVYEFSTPVKVKQLLQNHPHHFVCCSRDLHAVGTSRPLAANKELQMGEIYFMLPFSALDSHDNLAALVGRLLAAAKKGPPKPAEGRVAMDSKTRYSMMYEELMGSCGDTQLQKAYKEHLVTKARSWRPVLDTIKETSLNK